VGFLNGKRIPNLSFELSPIGGFATPDAIRPELSPLLEEEGDAGAHTLPPDAAGPLFLHRSRSMSRLPAHYDPMDAREVKDTEIFQERLYRQEAHFCSYFSKVIDSMQSALILYRYA
jgi:hypothetical protein